jgi:hypothetical protein
MLESAPGRRNTEYEAAEGCNSGRDGLGAGVEDGRDYFASRFFTRAAAARDGEVRLHFVERSGAAVHDFPDLAIADRMTYANVHGFSGPRETAPSEYK